MSVLGTVGENVDRFWPQICSLLLYRGSWLQWIFHLHFAYSYTNSFHYAVIFPFPEHFQILLQFWLQHSIINHSFISIKYIRVTNCNIKCNIYFQEKKWKKLLKEGREGKLLLYLKLLCCGKVCRNQRRQSIIKIGNEFFFQQQEPSRKITGWKKTDTKTCWPLQ